MLAPLNAREWNSDGGKSGASFASLPVEIDWLKNGFVTAALRQPDACPLTCWAFAVVRYV